MKATFFVCQLPHLLKSDNISYMAVLLGYLNLVCKQAIFGRPKSCFINFAYDYSECISAVKDKLILMTQK